jgi:FkbM family methyltransferase
MNRAPLLETGGFNQVVKGYGGYYIYNVHDMYIGRSIATYGEYAGLEAHFLEQLCGVGDMVIEVGANIGALTVPIANRVGPTGGVLAFEPQHLVFQSLCANIALNSLTNVDCYWAAVDTTSGSVVVPELDVRQQNNFGGVSIVGARHGRRIPSFALDEFQFLPKLRLIKIDVEGMEQAVIRGGTQLIAKFRPVLYVENDRVDQSESLMRLIDSLGYVMYWHIPRLFNPDNFFGEMVNIFGSVGSFNMVCVHRDENANTQGLQRITDFASHPLRKP